MELPFGVDLLVLAAWAEGKPWQAKINKLSGGGESESNSVAAMYLK